MRSPPVTRRADAHAQPAWAPVVSSGAVLPRAFRRCLWGRSEVRHIPYPLSGGLSNHDTRQHRRQCRATHLVFKYSIHAAARGPLATHASLRSDCKTPVCHGLVGPKFANARSQGTRRSLSPIGRNVPGPHVSRRWSSVALHRFQASGAVARRGTLPSRDTSSHHLSPPQRSGRIDREERGSVKE